MTFQLPQNIDGRPMAVVGAGTLGRRIALMLCTQGAEVRLFDPKETPRAEGVAYVEEALPDVISKVPGGHPGRIVGTADLQETLDGAWLVVESVPEIASLKQTVLGDIDKHCASDAIITSNSSSYPSSQLIGEVKRPERVLTSHFYMPPRVLPVELMSCGKTDAAVIELLMKQLPKYGVVPFHVRKESVGLIFNRIWAAIKRESLYVVAEGVSTPQDVDNLYGLVIGGVGPFRTMDQVGMDVVLAIEEHYAQLRPGLPSAPRDLLKEYIDKGWLGIKSGHGFYDDYRKQT